MSRRTAVLSLTAVVVAVLAWRGLRTEPTPNPITPSMDMGELVPVADYRTSGPYTHENLAVFLIHGPETLDGSGDGIRLVRPVARQPGAPPEFFGSVRPTAELPPPLLQDLWRRLGTRAASGSATTRTLFVIRSAAPAPRAVRSHDKT